MTDEFHEEQAATRRAIRRIEDDVADLERNKVDHDDVRPIVTKQSESDSFMRARLSAIQSENDEVRNILKRMAESLTSIDDRLTKFKRDTDSEIQAVKSPIDTREKRGRGNIPLQLQFLLWLFAGVGLLALLQGAPQALLSVFPTLARGGF